MKIFDISRPLSQNEPVYPGNAKVKLDHTKTFEKDGSMLSQIFTGLHNGSHVDAPAHYVKNGRTVEKMELKRCIGWARVVDMYQVSGVMKNEIGGKDIRGIKPRRGEIILFKTRNSNPSKKFDEAFVHVNEDAARALVRAGVKAVGIDGPSIRKFRLRPDTVHPLLLKAGIAVYEGLNLDKIAKGRYYFIGLPLKIVGAEGSPVRAILIK
jgi:arylformamidase